MITLRKSGATGSSAGAARNVVSAQCRSVDNAGDLVRLASVELDTLYVERVNPYYRDQMPAYGIIIAKDNEVTCQVQTLGDVSVSAIDALTPGKVCYVGTNGRVTTTAPDAINSPSGIVLLQAIGYSGGVSRLSFTPTPVTLEISV